MQSSGGPAASTIVRLGLVQSACTADREANIGQAIAGIAAAAKRGARVVCLQEPEVFWAVGQFYRHFDQVSDERVLQVRRTHGVPGRQGDQPRAGLRAAGSTGSD